MFALKPQAEIFTSEVVRSIVVNITDYVGNHSYHENHERPSIIKLFLICNYMIFAYLSYFKEYQPLEPRAPRPCHRTLLLLLLVSPSCHWSFKVYFLGYSDWDRLLGFFKHTFKYLFKIFHLLWTFFKDLQMVNYFKSHLLATNRSSNATKAKMNTTMMTMTSQWKTCRLVFRLWKSRAISDPCESCKGSFEDARI